MQRNDVEVSKLVRDENKARGGNEADLVSGPSSGDQLHVPRINLLCVDDCTDNKQRVSYSSYEILLTSSLTLVLLIQRDVRVVVD